MFKYRRVVQLAAERGRTMHDLAAAVEANPGTVKRWMTGAAMPSPSFLARLAKVLKVPASTLYEVPEENRNLAYYRTLAGYSLAQLGPKLSISHVHLGRIETGAAAMPAHLVGRLQRYLELDDATMASAMERSRYAGILGTPSAIGLLSA
ncbi:helix-turn-helix domain-containing protein [Mycobacteroides abscessus]